VVSRVLVTGGGGFIGSYVVDELVARGLEVVVLDIRLDHAHGSAVAAAKLGVEFLMGDVRDAETVELALRGVDAVCHQASMVGLGVDMNDAPAYISHNDLGTATLLAAMYRTGFLGRLVLASSMVVYGDGAYRCHRHGPVRPAPRPPDRLAARIFEPGCPICGDALVPEAVTEDAPMDPRNVYAATKVHQEQLCTVMGRETGIPATALRYHNVYGPRMPRDTPYAGVASVFRSALESGRSPRVFEDGGQVRDFVHVEDVARANALALLAEPAVPGALNVASGTPQTIGRMASVLASAFGVDSGEALEPVVTGEYRLGDVRHVFASPRRAEAELGFRARIGFEEGIRSFARSPLREPAPA
jgi:dTDP-L-rhamnose 4-epimerase